MKFDVRWRKHDVQNPTQLCIATNWIVMLLIIMVHIHFVDSSFSQQYICKVRLLLTHGTQNVEPIKKNNNSVTLETEWGENSVGRK